MVNLFARLYGRTRQRTCATLMWASTASVQGVAVVAIALLALCRPATAQTAVASDAQIKAAYLHKLPGFVEWPPEAFASPSSPMVIGVVNADAVYEELSRQVSGRAFQGRAVELRRVERDATTMTLHVLFIGSKEPREIRRLVDKAAGRAVLTIASSSSIVETSAVLNLVELDGRIRVEASLPAAAKAGLKLSSRLLSVASRVVEAAP